MTANPPTPPRDDAPELDEILLNQQCWDFTDFLETTGTTLTCKGWNHIKPKLREIIQQHRASLATPAPDAGKVVKPLVWKRDPDNCGDDWFSRAWADVYCYEVGQIDRPGNAWWWQEDAVTGLCAEQGFSSETAAKAAAQSDYERRILAALTPAAQPTEAVAEPAADFASSRAEGMEPRQSESAPPAVPTDNTALVEALTDMIAVADQDGWDKSLTGRQIIIRNARAALASREATKEGE